MTVLLMLPAVVVTACFFLIWYGVEDAPGLATGGFDWPGLALVTLALGILHIALAEGHADEEFVAARTTGFEAGRPHSGYGCAWRRACAWAR